MIVICVPSSWETSGTEFVFRNKYRGVFEAVLRSGQAVCLESTTYPGTTEEELVPEWSNLDSK